MSARLADSSYASRRGALDSSLHRSVVRLVYQQGEVVGVEPRPAAKDPTESDGLGFVPDWFPTLMLGRWGAIGLAERVDDVLLGRHRGLMEVLFPKRPADVAGDF